MKVSASIKSNFKYHEVVVQSDDAAKAIQILSKTSGYGSSFNGGELLLLSLATCFCKDLYREAGKPNMAISGVEVLFKGEFRCSDDEIKDLIVLTDR